MMSQSQLSFASSNEIDPVILAPFEAPPDLNWKGQRWVRVDHLANQRKGAKKSQVWDLDDEYISLNSPDTHAWRCQIWSIPSMSAEVERVFSSARRLVTADRNRLQDTIIEMLALLKYWWSNEILVQ